MTSMNLIIVISSFLFSICIPGFAMFYYENRFEKKLSHPIISYIVTCLISVAGSLVFLWYDYEGLDVAKLVFLMICLIWIGKVDAAQQIIPNAFLWFMLAMRAFFAVCDFGICSREIFLELTVDAVLGVVLGSVVFIIAKAISPSSIGMGDIKLFAIIGLYVGSRLIIPIIICSLLCALFYGIYKMIKKEMKAKDSLSFGPYIAIGTITALMLGI